MTQAQRTTDRPRAERPLDNFTPHPLEVQQKQGLMWVARARARMSLDMAVYDTATLRKWRLLPPVERAEAYRREAQRLHAQVAFRSVSLHTQLECARRMELALYLARAEDPSLARAASYECAQEIRVILERKALVLGSMTRIRDTRIHNSMFPNMVW